MLRSIYRCGRLVMCAVALAACNDSTSPAAPPPEAPPTNVTPPPARLVGLGGYEQVAAPGAVLPQPLSVEAVTASGKPLPGVAVIFTVTEGGGAIAGDTAFTNSDGLAVSGAWTLGTTGPQTVTALAGGATATFTATALAPDVAPLAAPDDPGPATGTVSGRLAFVRADTLFVSDIGASTTTTLRRLPSHSPLVGTTALSPDRSQVAFVSNSSTDICIVAVAGSQVTCDGLGYHDLRRPAWSPDGRRLAFIGPWDVENIDGPFPYPPDMRDAFVEDMATFGLGRAGPFHAGLPSVTDLAWSPDGQKLAVALPEQRIYTINADGSDRQLVYYRTDVDNITGVRWSPDGKALALAMQLSQCRPDCDWGIVVVRLDGTGSRLLARAHGTSTRFLAVSSWSPDGSAVAYSAVDCSQDVAPCRPDVYVAGAAGGQSRLLLSNAELVGWWP